MTALSRDLGRQPYAPVFAAMQRFADARDESTTDEVWNVEHEAVFTQGQAGRAEHVLGAGDIPVVQIDRGGQVTYHGPGQLVVYPLLDLRRLKLGVRDYVDALEETVIRTLARWNIAAVRRRGAPGVYTGDAKIAALGIRVRRGCTLHGLALNVDGDLSPFMRINPCGFAGLRVTSMLESGAFQAGVSAAETGPGAVKPALLSTLGEVLGLALQSAPPPSLDTAAVRAA